MLGLPDAMTNLQVVLDYFWQNIFECNFGFLVHVLRVISDVFDDNLLQGYDIHLLVQILTEKCELMMADLIEKLNYTYQFFFHYYYILGL